MINTLYKRIIFVFMVTNALLVICLVPIAFSHPSKANPLIPPVPIPIEPLPITIYGDDGSTLILSAPDTFTADILTLSGDYLYSVTLVNGEYVHLEDSITFVHRSDPATTEHPIVHNTYTDKLDIFFDKEAYLNGESAFITGTATYIGEARELKRTWIDTYSITGEYAGGAQANLVPLHFELVSVEEIDPMDIGTSECDTYYTHVLKLPSEFFMYVTPEPTIIPMPTLTPTSTPVPTPFVTPSPTSTRTVEVISDNLVKIETPIGSPDTPAPPKPSTPFQVAVGALTSVMFLALSGLTINNATSLGCMMDMATHTLNQGMKITNKNITDIAQKTLSTNQYLASTQKANILTKTKSFFNLLLSGLRDMLTDEGRSYTSGKVSDKLNKRR